jgi:hypothetical protein
MRPELALQDGGIPKTWRFDPLTSQTSGLFVAHEVHKTSHLIFMLHLHKKYLFQTFNSQIVQMFTMYTRKWFERLTLYSEVQ